MLDGPSAKLSGTDALDVRLHLCNTLTFCHLRPAPVREHISPGSLKARVRGQRCMVSWEVNISARYSTGESSEGKKTAEPEHANDSHVSRLLLVHRRRALASCMAMTF